jgi:hypothetical protein
MTPPWPLTEEILRGLIAEDESRNVEFKQSGYDLAVSEQKGEFVKDILALANVTEREKNSYLLLGVEDRRHGGRILGIAEPLDADRLTQIIVSYTSPSIEMRVAHVTLDGKTVGIVGVLWTETHPYYALRDIGSTLSSSFVYTRRGATVGRLSLQELEYLIRAKGTRTGSMVAQDPLQCGFVDGGHWAGPTGPVLRIVNVADTIVNEIHLVFDVVSKVDASIFYRATIFTGIALEPEASREVELDLRTLSMMKDGKQVTTDSSIGRWLDVTARIRYRDRFGFLREIQSATFLSNW